jgi:integrase/recombinase XerD
MSTTAKIVFKKNKINKDGEIPIYIRITKDRVSRFYATSITVKEKNWDEKEKKVKKGHPNSARINNLLTQRLAELQAKALDWETTHKSIKKKTLRKEIAKTNDESFSGYFKKYIEYLKANKKLGTLDKADATYSKLHAFANTSNILFKEIDLEFLKKWETHLRDKLGNKVNTIHANMKMLRKLFNDAVREELIQYAQNPFSKFPLKTEKSKREFLTEEELKAIENLDLLIGSRINDHRNMFVFAAYSGGVRISDLFRLRWKDYNGTHINFIQQKTSEHIAIKLPTRALQILQYYKSLTGQNSENFVFPFLSNDIHEDLIFDAISSQTAYTNKNLKTIAKLAEVNKHLTTHIARHTFATRALRKGIRIEYVSKLLGHSSIKVTQIYAKIVSGELDKSMEIFDE